MNLLRRRSEPPSSPGQALAEFAIILPILLLLLVMAIDFGRVFFGWVALHNAARIGADTAARTPHSWPADNVEEDEDQDTYQSLIQADLDAINCHYADPLPDPTFQDTNGNGDDRDYGDHAVVHLTCEFSLLTPLAESILGGPVPMAAEATFPINGMLVLDLPEGENPPPEGGEGGEECEAGEAEVPDLVGMTVANARSTWTASFSGGFRPNGQNNKTVLNQTTNPASTPGDCLTTSASIEVTHD